MTLCCCVQVPTRTGACLRPWTSAGSWWGSSLRRCWRGSLRAPWPSSIPERPNTNRHRRCRPPPSAPAASRRSRCVKCRAINSPCSESFNVALTRQCSCLSARHGRGWNQTRRDVYSVNVQRGARAVCVSEYQDACHHLKIMLHLPQGGRIRL